MFRRKIENGDKSEALKKHIKQTISYESDKEAMFVLKKELGLLRLFLAFFVPFRGQGYF